MTVEITTEKLEAFREVYGQACMVLFMWKQGEDLGSDLEKLDAATEAVVDVDDRERKQVVKHG